MDKKKYKNVWFSNYLQELFQEFKVDHPSLKVGFSKFAMLHPDECVLAESRGTHTVVSVFVSYTRMSSS